MKKQKGSVMLIVGCIVIALLAGGGALYFKNKQSVSQEIVTAESNSGNFNPLSLGELSPKEIFLKRNSELYAARNFKEMEEVSLKYDDSVWRAKVEADLKYATPEKKQAFFTLAQAFIQPTEQFTNVTETIYGENATVTALDNKRNKITATFVKVDGSWKMRSSKTEISGKPN